MRAWISLLRPRQWIKNGFVIAPIFFAGLFEDGESWMLVLTAALAFGLSAGTVYIFNDMVDRKEDARHPVKSRRPLACGQVSLPAALVLALICALAAAFLLTRLPGDCSVIVGVYLALNLLYTFVLKHRALLDVFTVAIFFVLRVLMGCFALSVMVSPWIMLTTFTLALFLGFGKRYHELGFEAYATGKKNLKEYSRELLDKLVVICSGGAFVCYAIYAAETAEAMDDIRIIYTVPFVAFGLFRYLQSVYVYAQGGEPESVILQDKWQWVTIALWLGVTLWALG